MRPSAANIIYANPILPYPLKILPPLSNDPDASMNTDTTAGSRVLMYKAMQINVNGIRKKPDPNRSVNGLNIVLNGLFINSVPFTAIFFIRSLLAYL